MCWTLLTGGSPGTMQNSTFEKTRFITTHNMIFIVQSVCSGWKTYPSSLLCRLVPAGYAGNTYQGKFLRAMLIRSSSLHVGGELPLWNPSPNLHHQPHVFRISFSSLVTTDWLYVNINWLVNWWLCLLAYTSVKRSRPGWLLHHWRLHTTLPVNLALDFRSALINKTLRYLTSLTCHSNSSSPHSEHSTLSCLSTMSWDLKGWTWPWLLFIRKTVQKCAEIIDSLDECHCKIMY